MSMIPKGSSTLGNESAFGSGQLVMYEQDGSAMLGVITGSKRSKFQVLNMRERDVELNGPRLSVLPARMPSDYASRSDQAAYLLALYEKSQENSEDFPVEELWNFLKDEQRPYNTAELSELYFGSDSLDDHLRLRVALINDRIFFKRKKNEFVPRPPENVEELKLAEQARLEKEQLIGKTVEEFRKRLKDKNYQFSEDVSENIDLLKKVAAGASHIDQGKQKEAQKLIEHCVDELGVSVGGKKEERAFDLLCRIGEFHKNTNLSFIRHSVDHPYSVHSLQQARELEETPEYQELSDEEKSYRKDLTHLSAITIDDESTQDMDDALSVEMTSGGYIIGIHITDVASAIPIDSALDKEAHTRATSIYCPEKSINMLPPELSEDKLSLIAGKPRRCLSFLVELSKNLEIGSYEIVPSLIKVQERLSYNQVEELLSQDYHPAESGPGAVHLLYNAAMAYEAERIGCGALKIPKRMVAVELTEPERIEHSDFRIVEVNENGPSRSLIGEMMILANNLAARYAEQHQIPFIFRSQEQPAPDSKKDPGLVPEGPARDYAMRGNLMRSSTSLESAPHATLGLDLYAQTTSPIRRFQDLCNQRQLVGQLVKEKPTYSPDDLRFLMQQADDALQRAMQVTRETRKYWLYKYLKRRSKNKMPIKGTVIRTDLKHPLVELDEIYINAIIRTREKFKPGDEVDIKIVAVDPRYDYLRLDLA